MVPLFLLFFFPDNWWLCHKKESVSKVKWLQAGRDFSINTMYSFGLFRSLLILFVSLYSSLLLVYDFNKCSCTVLAHVTKLNLFYLTRRLSYQITNYLKLYKQYTHAKNKGHLLLNLYKSLFTLEKKQNSDFLHSIESGI